MAVDYIIIGKRIREIRIQRGMTQSLLAEKSGIEPSNISHIERAATKVSLPTLISIANALQVTLDELVYDNLVKSSRVSIDIINDLLLDCTPDELADLAEIIKTVKYVLKNRKDNK